MAAISIPSYGSYGTMADYREKPTKTPIRSKWRCPKPPWDMGLSPVIIHFCFGFTLW
jgi:hypothetical protein